MEGALLGTPLALCLAQAIAIISFSRLLGIGARRIGQPLVMAELVAGILLGPSFLGWAAPELSTALFPPSSIPLLSQLSQVGTVLFMLFMLFMGTAMSIAAFPVLARIPTERKLMTTRIGATAIACAAVDDAARTGSRSSSPSAWRIWWWSSCSRSSSRSAASGPTSGSSGAASRGRATGLPGREAGALGILMNTRGMMEVVVNLALIYEPERS